MKAPVLEDEALRRTATRRPLVSRLRPLALASACVAAALAGAASCGPPIPDPSPPGPKPEPIVSAAPATPPSGAPTLALTGAPSAAPVDDVCANNPKPPREYFGLLASARCDQEMFLTMAGIAGQLGVECRHCHAPHPTDAKKEDYPKPTPKKEVANWMNMHLMKAVKTADGSPLKCKSCHVDPATGKPVAKILGTPRDAVKAQEWMSMVMVNKFVSAKGEKLKCKSCHVDNFTKPGFQAKVILRTNQIPPH